MDLERVFTSNDPRVRFRFARVVDINRFALVDPLLSVSRAHADLARPARSDAFDARVVVADVVFSSRFPAGDALSRRTSVLHILAFFDATDRIAVDTLTESKSGAASIVQTRSMPRDAPTALLRATRERERERERKTTAITSPASRARQLFETSTIVTVELTMTE